MGKNTKADLAMDALWLLLGGGAAWGLYRTLPWFGAGPLGSDANEVPEPPPVSDPSADPAPGQEGLLRDPMGRHFFGSEFLVSGSRPDLAANLVPSPSQWEQVRALAVTTLDPLRDAVGPLLITSGYRSSELNFAVGGSATSQHTAPGAISPVGPAAAVDIRPPTGYSSADLVYELVRRGIPFDQAAAYSPSRGGHLHVSLRTDGNNRGALAVVTGDGWQSQPDAESVIEAYNVAALGGV